MEYKEDVLLIWADIVLDDYAYGGSDICICYIAPVQIQCLSILHLPRRASWHCVGWLLDGHWILKRNYAVYAYDIYVSV